MKQLSLCCIVMFADSMIHSQLAQTIAAQILILIIPIITLIKILLIPILPLILLLPLQMTIIPPPILLLLPLLPILPILPIILIVFHFQFSLQSHRSFIFPHSCTISSIILGRFVSTSPLRLSPLVIGFCFEGVVIYP